MKTKFLIQAGFVVVLLAGCATHQQVALQRNKAIIYRYFEEWGNHGDTKAPDELIATNVTLRNPPAVIHSLADYKKGMAVFHTAFPDLHFTVEEGGCRRGQGRGVLVAERHAIGGLPRPPAHGQASVGDGYELVSAGGGQDPRDYREHGSTGPVATVGLGTAAGEWEIIFNSG